MVVKLLTIKSSSPPVRISAADSCHDGDGCLVYRTIEDLEDMQAFAKKSKTGVVVGGGLLGLECANALKNMGLETVVEFAPQLMGVQIDPEGAILKVSLRTSVSPYTWRPPTLFMVRKPLTAWNSKTRPPSTPI